MPSNRTDDFLSPARYDDDAASLRSASDQDSDSEDDEIVGAARSTLELNEHDQAILKEEEEREKLLTKTSPVQGLRRIFSGGLDNGSSVKIGKREKRRRRREAQRAERRKRQGGDGEEGELMFEMEEGFKDNSGSSTPSVDLDRRKWDTIAEKQARRTLCRKFAFIYAAIFVLFLILLLGAYKVSKSFRSGHHVKTLSNGTFMFAPTTILISLDGFRADFLTRGLTPTLNSFISKGISPLYMLPSFPSVTFPNHFTLVTGLYPESHGVVGNQFWDPELLEEFYYTDPTRSMQPKWWTAEPLWATAEKQGVRSAIHMWPGSEAHIPPVEPTFMDKYNGSEVLSRKVDRVLGWLDLPGDEEEAAVMGLSTPDRRPQLIATYVPNVDSDGHLYGPNSTEIRDTISAVDNMLKNIFDGLDERNLTDIVNVVVVSDHGMATTSTDRLIQLDDLIDLNLVDHIDGWPLRGLRLKDLNDLQPMYETLLEASKHSDNFEVYTRETMPERYHFSNNDRIAPLWVVPKTGWAVVERDNFDVEEAKKTGAIYHPKGLHGYDHEHPLMRAIFVARGPSFPHKPNSRIEPFQNTEVYNIVCDSLGIKPLSNNGTLHLPLKPVGLHSDPTAPKVPAPEDPAKGSSSVTSEEVTPPSEVGQGENVSSDEAPQEDESVEETKAKAWWAFLSSSFKDAKEWVHELLESWKQNNPDTATEEPQKRN